MTNELTELSKLLEKRIEANQDSSYVASLSRAGLNKILEKVGEEATETIIAAKDGDRENVIKETADLWFHTLVMLSYLNLSADDIIDELNRRSGVSGLDEKAARTNNAG